MLFGMGTVFVFLVVLIVCTTIMSRMVLRFAPADSPAVETGSSLQHGDTAQDPERARLIAAIGAVVHKHHTKRGD